MRAPHAARALVALLALLGASIPVAAQAGTARAEVIVDTGSGVHTTVVQFDGVISGLEALSLAGADPKTLDYGALGKAVCLLYGVGDPVLPGQCPGGWTYYRAVGGASGWTQSSLGASSTSVHDGDVEGWKYGGGAPPFTSFCAAVGCAPPPTAAPPTVPPAATSAVSTSPGGPTATDAAPGATTGTASGVTTPPPTTTPSIGGPTTTTTTAEVQQPAAGRRNGSQRAASPTHNRGGGGGSPAGVVIAAALLGAVAGGVFLRRRRSRTVAG
jgi:hypothetical protein